MACSSFLPTKHEWSWVSSLAKLGFSHHQQDQHDNPVPQQSKDYVSSTVPALLEDSMPDIIVTLPKWHIYHAEYSTYIWHCNRHTVSWQLCASQKGPPSELHFSGWYFTSLKKAHKPEKAKHVLVYNGQYLEWLCESPGWFLNLIEK